MRLQAYLVHASLTPSGLARRLGVSPSTVIRWVDGTVTPSFGAMERLHELTGGAVSPNDFMGRIMPLGNGGDPQKKIGPASCL